MASSSNAIVASAAAQPRRNDTPALPMPMPTTPAPFATRLTRLVESKTRFCHFCGNRFCAVFRPKRACAGCGGTICGACSIEIQATRGNRPLRVCPGCDARLTAYPNFVDHMNERREHGEGVCNTVTSASSQTSPSSPSSSAVSSSSTSSPPSLVFSSIATQTSPCLVITPSPSFAAPASVIGTGGYTVTMTIMPPSTTEPRPSASPLAWLLRAIGSPSNNNSNTSSTNRNTDNGNNNIANNIRSNSSSNVSIGSISSNTSSNSGSNNRARHQDETLASRMGQGEEFLRQKAAGITKGILRKRYGVMGLAAVMVGVTGLAAFVGRSRSRR